MNLPNKFPECDSASLSSSRLIGSRGRFGLVAALAILFLIFGSSTANAQGKKKKKGMPAPVIELPQMEGWDSGEPREMDPQDNGYTVAYNHATPNITLTFYQYTRRYPEILDDVELDPVKSELQFAHDAIDQAVKLKYYDAAEKISSDVRNVGESQQKAQWSHFKITRGEVVSDSETYIWSYNQTILKLRITYDGNQDGVKEKLAVIVDMLGKATDAARENAGKGNEAKSDGN